MKKILLGLLVLFSIGERAGAIDIDPYFGANAGVAMPKGWPWPGVAESVELGAEIAKYFRLEAGMESLSFKGPLARTDILQFSLGAQLPIGDDWKTYVGYGRKHTYGLPGIFNQAKVGIAYRIYPERWLTLGFSNEVDRNRVSTVKLGIQSFF